MIGLSRQPSSKSSSRSAVLSTQHSKTPLRTAGTLLSNQAFTTFPCVGTSQPAMGRKGVFMSLTRKCRPLGEFSGRPQAKSAHRPHVQYRPYYGEERERVQSDAVRVSPVKAEQPRAIESLPDEYLSQNKNQSFTMDAYNCSLDVSLFNQC